MRYFGGGGGMVGMREVKETVRKVDWERLVGRCKDKAYRIAIGWGKLWDHAMSLGLRHTRGLQNLSRLMSSHGKGERPCPVCGGAEDVGDVLSHLLSEHGQEMGFGGDDGEVG